MGFDSISRGSQDRPRAMDDPYRRWPDGSSLIERADRDHTRRLPALPARLPQGATLCAIKMNAEGITDFGDLESTLAAVLHHEQATLAGTAAEPAWTALLEEYKKSSVLRIKFFNEAQRNLNADARQANPRTRPALEVRMGRLVDVFAFLSGEDQAEVREVAQQWLERAESGAKSIGEQAVAAEARRELRESHSLAEALQGRSQLGL